MKNFKNSIYNYSTAFEREETVENLLSYARQARQTKDDYWEKMRRYYDGNHDIMKSTSPFALSKSLPWIPAQSTDGFIHVESQINAKIPDFEFSPRDKSDYDKAKQREKIVRYVCDNSNLDFKNSRNERTLGIYGSAVWKVCFDGFAKYGEDGNDVSILMPNPKEIFTDPGASDIDSCEYIGYCYKLSISKAKRIFGGDFKMLGTSIEDYLDTSFALTALDNDEYSIDVTEWWYRQPEDGKCTVKRMTNGKEKSLEYTWHAGDIALSIFLGGKEIRNIPKYWRKTSFSQYPFVIYSKIPMENSIWGKSELEHIIPLIDAKDRELAFAQLNSAFSSNDIILMEENALAENERLDNSPGAMWKLRPGMMGKVQRLGNMAASQNSLYTGTSYWQSLIEDTTGNFEVNQGKEPTSVTTATGIALLNERAESRRSMKNIDRNYGFKRLFDLVDKTALEYYSDGKVIRLGATSEDFVYSYGGFIKKTRETSYIPSVDVTIHTGSAISNSKAFTVSALTSLIDMNINEDNYKLVKAYVETIGIPERGEICSYLDEKFSSEGQSITEDEILSIIKKSIESEEQINERE